jgi:hypothetical protein
LEKNQLCYYTELHQENSAPQYWVAIVIAVVVGAVGVGGGVLGVVLYQRKKRRQKFAKKFEMSNVSTTNI